jgi:putative intracellular protease/amidase
MTGISSETANDDSTRRMQDEGKLVVSVCHGPAGLLPAIRADGSWVFQGYRLTSFTERGPPRMKHRSMIANG